VGGVAGVASSFDIKVISSLAGAEKWLLQNH
jgi:hypothetical protein